MTWQKDLRRDVEKLQEYHGASSSLQSTVSSILKGGYSKKDHILAILQDHINYRKSNPIFAEMEGIKYAFGEAKSFDIIPIPQLQPNVIYEVDPEPEVPLYPTLQKQPARWKYQKT